MVSSLKEKETFTLLDHLSYLSAVFYLNSILLTIQNYFLFRSQLTKELKTLSLSDQD